MSPCFGTEIQQRITDSILLWIKSLGIEGTGLK